MLPMICVFLLTFASAAAMGDYPYATQPQIPPFHLRTTAGNSSCLNCPWNRADMGPYPLPYNAPTSFVPLHRGQYFDVYGHWMETRYSEVIDALTRHSQPKMTAALECFMSYSPSNILLFLQLKVFWTAQPAVALPDDIVQQFAGRVISFTGFEVGLCNRKRYLCYPPTLQI